MTMAISESIGPSVASDAMQGTAGYDHLLYGIAVLDGQRRLQYYNQAFADYLSRQTGLQLTTSDLIDQELPLAPLWDVEPDAECCNWQCQLPGGEGMLVASRQDDGALNGIHANAVYLLQLLPVVSRSGELSNDLAGAITHGQSGSKEKIELLTSFSHEFRTPLNAVLGFGNLLLNDVTQPTQREYVQGIIGAGSHLLKLVNEILTLSKAEYDCSEIDLRTENVDVAAVVAECVSLMQPMAKEAGTQMVQKGEACHLICDQTRLRQIIINLLSNAIKYGCVPGEVAINTLSVGNRCAGIEVQDNGMGIPEELTETIFNPFKRLLMGAANTEGSGIGLMLTRRLVNMMGGRIRVCSRIGRGSVFSVDFNLDQDMAGTAGEQSRTVLCLGEDSEEQQFVRQLLAVRPGINVFCHEHVPLVALGNGELRPDLIILCGDPLSVEDLQAEATLKELLRRIPGLSVRDIAQPDLPRRLEELGVTGRLGENFTPVEFYSLLDGVLPR